MVRTERVGWALEIYHPLCPNALEGDHGHGSPADIVLVGVPNREGSRLACVRRIKALAPDLPVLIISGDADHASIVECCAAGIAGYVLKPFAPGELARVVSSVARGWPVLCREAVARGGQSVTHFSRFLLVHCSIRGGVMAMLK